jgi:hypothetical protein
MFVMVFASLFVTEQCFVLRLLMLRWQKLRLWVLHPLALRLSAFRLPLLRLSVLRWQELRLPMLRLLLLRLLRQHCSFFVILSRNCSGRGEIPHRR